MMGSASGVNNTFDRVLDYYGLNFGEYDYFEAASIYDEHDYKHEGDFTLVYYIRKNEDNLDDLISFDHFERLVKTAFQFKRKTIKKLGSRLTSY